jgi:NADH dehydrogenase (ubiquinone) Fe-S protein 4
MYHNRSSFIKVISQNWGQVLLLTNSTKQSSSSLSFVPILFNTSSSLCVNYSTDETKKDHDPQQNRGMINNNNMEEKEKKSIEKDILKHVAGLPDQQFKRKVIIHQPSRNAMQQGVDKHKKWRLEWSRDNNFGQRWADPLMGWNATTDPLNSSYLFFDSKEAAIQYAQRYGFEVEVEESYEEPPPARSYSDNFKYRKEEKQEGEEW